MEKVILDKSSYVNKNNEKVFVYTLIKPKYDFENKKFDGIEFFNIYSKTEYQLLDIVKVEYNKVNKVYEIVELVSTEF